MQMRMTSSEGVGDHRKASDITGSRKHKGRTPELLLYYSKKGGYICKRFSQVRHAGEKTVPCPARRRKLERMCSPELKEKHCRKGKIRIATNCKAVYSCRLFMHNCQSCLFSLDNERFFYSSERVAGHWFLWRIKSTQTIVSARTGNMKRFLNVGFAVFAGVMVLYMLEFHLLEGHRQYFLLVLAS